MALCGHSEPWSETWPAWGMSAGGAVFALPTPAPLTDGSACSSLPTLPTPTTDDSWGSRGNNDFDRTFLLPTPQADTSTTTQHGKPALQALLLTLPTPTASVATGAGTQGRDGGPNLQTAVDLLPTPRATDGTKGGPNQRGSSGDLMLPSAVQLLPTPTVCDPDFGSVAAAQTRMDSDWQTPGLSAVVLTSTSARTPPPSTGGNTP